MAAPASDSDVHIQTWDIETTGGKLPHGKDKVFAVGSATFRVNVTTGKAAEVEMRRWVLRIGEPAESHRWRLDWEEAGWDMVCWEEFWSMHVDKLNALMSVTADMFETQSDMVRSIAAHIKETEEKYPNLQRVYDTIGFDITNLDEMLRREGFTTLHRMHTTGRPAKVSYLSTITYAALRMDPFDRNYSEAQYAVLREHNAAALPLGLAHTHDPADDARCIGYKWIYFANLLRNQWK